MRQYWEQFKARVMPLVARIEESPLFERAVMRFESLDTQHQKWIRGGATLLSALLALYLLLFPAINVWTGKYELSQFRHLLSEMQEYNSRTEVIEQPAPRPAGWQDLPVGNLEEADASLKQVLASMGIDPEEEGVFSRNGNDFKLALREISVRQLSSLNFQFDGWHPRIKGQSLKVRINPTHKDLLDADFRLSFNPLAQVPSAGATGGAASVGGIPSIPDDTGDDFEAPPPPPPSGARPARPFPRANNDDGNFTLPQESGGPSSAPSIPAPPPEMNEEELLPPPPVEEDAS